MLTLMPGGDVDDVCVEAGGRRLEATGGLLIDLIELREPRSSPPRVVMFELPMMSAMIATRSSACQATPPP